MTLLILALSGDPYAIDEGRFTARVGAAGLLSGFGHEHILALRDFWGEARLGPAGPVGGTVRLGVWADSVAEIGEDFSAEERKKIDRDVQTRVLQVEKHPRIQFRGSVVSAIPLGKNRFEVRIDGHLTLRGVTRPLTIPAELALRGDVLTARGKFSIRHSEYGLERLSAVGGLVKASDEIGFSFDLQGRLQKR